MKTTKTIEIWSDFACPYCYIGERRLKDAIKQLGVEAEIKFVYRAFELDPNAAVHTHGDVKDRMAEKYGISKEEAKKRIDNIDELGRDLGIDMKFGKSKGCNTFDAHRLMKFAEANYEPVIVEALNEALFKAYFTDSAELSNRKVLLEIAESVAMDPIQSKDLLESDMYANDVRYDEKQAANMGVRGVPFMVFDAQFAVPGAISTEDCKAVVLEMLGKEKVDNTKIDADAKTCDENGCKI